MADRFATGALAPTDALDRCLIVLLRTRFAPQTLADARTCTEASDMDWAAFQERAVTAGVGPLLYATLRGRDVLPPEVETALRQSYFQNARQNLLRFQELAILLRDLQAHGVEVLVLKGAALAEGVYDNLAVRPMCDVDLLVRTDRAQAALDRLHALGYETLTTERRPGDMLAYENEAMLRKDAFLLEIHWHLFDSPHYQRVLDAAWLWATARPLKLKGAPARTLGPEAQLLHLCGHLMLHHGAGETLRLLWLHDIAETIARSGPKMDWDLLLDRAQAFDLVLPVQRLLPALHARWAAPVPEDVLARLRTLTPSSAEAQTFTRLVEPAQSVTQRLWVDLATMPGWRARLAFAFHNIVPAPAYMRQRYKLPSPLLLPLAYLYRWLLGLRGWLAWQLHRSRPPHTHPDDRAGHQEPSLHIDN